MTLSQNAYEAQQLEHKVRDLRVKLVSLPEMWAARVVRITGEIDKLLGEMPKLDRPTLIHVVGADKARKTSYVLDLYDSDELRTLLNVRESAGDQHTAVPCVFEPADVPQMRIQRRSLTDLERVELDNLSPKQFAQLYDHATAKPGGYLLWILIPKAPLKFTRTVIEYPGVKLSAAGSDAEKVKHDLMRSDMSTVLKQLPGLVVACFGEGFSIPPGHPLDLILREYQVTLAQAGAPRPPLLLSLQGRDIIERYCGNTHLLDILAKEFPGHKQFKTTVQLVNPLNSKYVVTFPTPGEGVNEWIQSPISQYKSLDEIRDEIKRDGGIAWSRKLLDVLCDAPAIREALDYLCLGGWLVEAKKRYEDWAREYDYMYSYDFIKVTRERIRKKIVSEPAHYNSVRALLKDPKMADAETDPRRMVDAQAKLWTKVITDYLAQFFPGDSRPACTEVAIALWAVIEKGLNPDQLGFIRVRAGDVSAMICNLVEIYVPNALVRGDPIIFERLRREQHPDDQ